MLVGVGTSNDVTAKKLDIPSDKIYVICIHVQHSVPIDSHTHVNILAPDLVDYSETIANNSKIYQVIL